LPSDLPPPPNYWTGFYAGGFLGGAHGVWSADFYRNNDYAPAEKGATGVAGGLFLGYNYHINPSLVIGIEADLGATSAKQSFDVLGYGTSSAYDGPFGSVRARIGYAFDRLLVYGTGGSGFANLATEMQSGRSAGDQIIRDAQWRAGYLLGTGFEFAFGRNFFARAEYLYANHGTVTLYNPDGNRASTTTELHQARAGIGYRF
jgi:outer membrane immunogenic protein